MNLGAPEMLLLGILALILFGPRRLPELGKALGEGLAAFRESSRQLSSEFKRQLEEETAPPVTPTPPLAAEMLLGTPMQGQASSTLSPVEATLEETPEESVSQDELAEVFERLEKERQEPLALAAPEEHPTASSETVKAV